MPEEIRRTMSVSVALSSRRNATRRSSRWPRRIASRAVNTCAAISAALLTVVTLVARSRPLSPLCGRITRTSRAPWPCAHRGGRRPFRRVERLRSVARHVASDVSYCRRNASYSGSAPFSTSAMVGPARWVPSLPRAPTTNWSASLSQSWSRERRWGPSSSARKISRLS